LARWKGRRDVMHTVSTKGGGGCKFADGNLGQLESWRGHFIPQGLYRGRDQPVVFLQLHDGAV
jgi:hypothetical protein